MGRIFLTFLLTLIPLHVYAIASCENWASPAQSEECNEQPGCYWDDGADYSCKACDEQHFGPKCVSLCSNPTNASEYPGAGSDFPFAHQYMRPTTGGNSEAIRGARTKYECYKQLDGGTGNGHGAKCTGIDGTQVNSECHEYYRDGTTNSGNTTDTSISIIYKGNAAHHWVSCPDADSQYDIGEENNNTHDNPGYHMENNNTECYANKLTCKSFHAFAGNNSSATSLTCDSTTGYLVYDTNTSTAYLWQNDGETRCTCDINGGELNDQSTNNYICTTSETTYRQFQTGYILSPQSTVQNTKIYYYATPSDWTCESCKAGYVGFFKRANNDNRQKCVPAMQGCYSAGCNGNNCVSSSNDPGDTISCVTNGTGIFANLYSGLSLFYHPCYAGMTTNNTGSTTRNDCHYTNDTQFCDAYGCVSMDQLLNATQTSFPDDWTWYMQQ